MDTLQFLYLMSRDCTSFTLLATCHS